MEAPLILLLILLVVLLIVGPILGIIAYAGVRRLDETEDAEIKPVSRVLARQILESDIENLDLFD